MNRARTLLVAAVVMTLGGAPWCAASSVADTDGDGLPDLAVVDDWDGDGVLEIEDDLQAAIDALTDDGPKRVEIGPGTYVAPVAPTGLKGILEIPSRTTVVGAGRGATILRGVPQSDLVTRLAVVSNADHDGGNHDIVISDLAVDGGWIDGDAEGFQQHRMGILLNGCRDCVVERVGVRNTLHACLYSKNGSGVTFRDATLRNCGNVGGRGVTFPCVYLFAEAGRVQDGVTVADVECRWSGGVALACRRGGPSAALRNIVFERVQVYDTRLVDGRAKPCATPRGADGIVYRDLTCRRTGPFTSYGGVDAFLSDGGNENATRNLLVERLVMEPAGRSLGLQLLGRLEGATFRDVTIRGAPDGDCIAIEGDLRDVVLEDVVATDCARWGLRDIGASPTVEPGPTLRRVTIEGGGAAGTGEGGILLVQDRTGFVVEGLTLVGPSSDGVRVLGALRDSRLTDVRVEAAGNHALFLAGGADGLRVDGLEAIAPGADGVHLARPQDGAAYREVTLHGPVVRGAGGHGVGTSGGPVFDGLSILGGLVDGAGDIAIRVSAANAPPSHAIRIESTRIVDPQGATAVLVEGVSTDDRIAGVVRTGAPAGAPPGFRYDADSAPPSGYCTNSCLPWRDDACLSTGSQLGFEIDADGDGLVEACDLCPGLYDPRQQDADGDGQGDACDPDDDGDGIDDAADVCPGRSDPGQQDGDGDGVGDACDNCPAQPNGSQFDFDRDGVGGACDGCPGVADPAQRDRDGDGQGDACDLDDGVTMLGRMGVALAAWVPELGSTAWNAYVGRLGALRAGGAYVQAPAAEPLASRTCGLATPEFAWPTPPPGAGVFLLVTASEGEGLGDGPAGAPRFDAGVCAP